MFLLLVAALAFAGDDPPDGVFALPESGFTLNAPTWHMSRWSDWDFRGHNADKSIFASAWSTSYQLVLDDATAKALADAWKERLTGEEHATEVTIASANVEEAAGQKRVRARLDFTTSGGVKGVYHAAAFSTGGLTAQVATLAAATNSARAAAALDSLLERATITRPAAAIGAAEELATPRGKVALLPGWRNPLPSEGASVAALYGKTGAKDADLCTAAINPRVGGEADVLLTCAEAASGGILDESSFDDEAALFAQRTFGKLASKLPPPERVPHGESVGILYHANAGLWVGALQTEGGTQVVWASGDEANDEALGEAARTTLRTYVLSPEATPNPSFGALMAHRLAYQKTHPTVLIPGVLALALLGFIVRMILRSQPPDELHHPH